MNAKPNDAELLATAIHDPEAFGFFYDRFEGDVLAFFVRATGRPDIAADLTAETFARALESMRGYDGHLGAPRAWLFGIARHLLSDAWQRGRIEDGARRRLQLEPLGLTDDALERIAELGDAEPAMAMRLLAGLPEEQRSAVTAHVLEERPYAELARELECSESVVRQRVSRGLRRIRSRLEQMR
jgi:RNA polymerase sigma-70 factor (ECF subfamily)